MHRLLPLLLASIGLAHVSHAQTYVIKSSPCPNLDDDFGQSAVILDYDGDGVNDLAVGASGEAAVYVFFGPTLATWQAILPSGPLPAGICPPDDVASGFGASLAAASLDAAAGAELLVGATNGGGGAGEVRIFGATFGAPVLLSSSVPQLGAKFGYRLAVADFDGDNLIDLAVGAPESIPTGHGCVNPYAIGRVHLFYGGLLGGVVQEAVIENPQLATPAACNGFFGVDLAAADGDSDGLVDLYASAEGNGFLGFPDAGSVSFFANPVVVGGVVQSSTTIGDTNLQVCNPATRYGKSIDARGAGLLVGAPIKSSVGDSCATPFVGGAFLYTGPSFGGLQLTSTPPPPAHGRLGYRVALVDRIGDSQPDCVAKLMGDNKLYMWDGANPTGAPIIVPGPSSPSIHWWIGTARGQLVAGGYEELVMGDPEFNGHTGRVAIWR